MEQSQEAIDIHKIKNELTSMKAKLDIIHGAIVGNPLSNDGGMAKRLLENENELLKLEKRISELEMKEDKQAFYLKIIWALVGGAIVSTVYYFFSAFGSAIFHK